ncbi:MAG: cation transporter [Oscillospiraceae bacterium]|nr:cation transporter [Oscillospiraceae bacterium]
MLSILSRIFIKNRTDYKNPAVRKAYGTLCGFMGIFLNIVLFAAKFLAGTLSGSVAITADAFNNLSDAGSSVITLIGFALAGKKPEPEHPFGHGRIEYISGLVVAAIIILMGFELAKSSFQKIISPVPVESSVITIVILILSVAVKVYMSLYNRSIGKKINSGAMKATAADSLSDAVATAVVLISIAVQHFTGFNIDGWAGLIVALMILYAGYGAAKDTLTPLLGQKPDDEFVDEVFSIILAHEEVVGVHDLIVHDYGPGRIMLSAHAEVPGDVDIFAIHDVIDIIEQELKAKLGCEAVLHMDPIETKNEKVAEMRAAVAEIVGCMDMGITIHDFRMVPGDTHTNLIFDAVVPFNCKLSDDEVRAQLQERISAKFANHFAVITIDKPYT